MKQQNRLNLFTPLANIHAALVGMAILISFFGACSSPQNDKIKEVDWLVGVWEYKSPDGSIYEMWQKDTANRLRGKSYFLQGSDTLVLETLELLYEQGTFYYIPTVTDQNEGLPVRFVATVVSTTELVFENAEHDFPQVIAYKKVSEDALVAEVSDSQRSEESKQVFSMQRLE